MNTIKKLWQRGLCTFLSISIAMTLLPVRTAHANVSTCDAFASVNGTAPDCVGATIGGVPYAAPKIKWERVSELQTSVQTGSDNITGTPESIILANRAAQELGISESDLANFATVYPSNVPYVYGRYNPQDATLRIDMFKLERYTENGIPRIGLLHAAFTPEHGNHWLLNRSYISPSAYQLGTSPGVNPFASFARSGSESFHNISLEGAKVAVGHAQRLVGAPMSLLQLMEVRLSQRTKKSGNAFKKKIEMWVYAHAKPRWFIGQPVQTLQRTSTEPMSAMCATDPAASSCPAYATAVAGVNFEEFSGGSLKSNEDTWTIDYKKKSGLGFLGALVLGVLGSFAMAGIMSAAGFGTAAGATTAGTAGTTMGTWGSFLANSGVISSQMSLAGAIAVEAAFVSGSMVLQGANLGSIIKADGGILLGNVQTMNGKLTPGDLSEYGRRANAQVSPRTNSSLREMTTGSEKTLSAFSGTLLGDCPLNSPNCANAGVLPRPDAHVQTNAYKLQKEFKSSRGYRDTTLR